MTKKKEDLVFEKKKQVWTDSIKIAKKFQKRHVDVMRAIENAHCSKGFRQRNFADSKLLQSNGIEQDIYLMTWKGYSFVIMAFTGKEAGKFKEDFIEAFDLMQTELDRQKINHSNDEWNATRLDNKQSNKDFNEALKEFVEYVEADGRSGMPSRYYMLFNNMVNHTLFAFPKKLKNIPELLDKAQLKFSDSTKQALADEMTKGIKARLYYKDIYKNCKERAELIARGLGVTPIPMLLENEENNLTLI